MKKPAATAVVKKEKAKVGSIKLPKRIAARRLAYRLDEFTQAVATGWFGASATPPLPGQVGEFAQDPRTEPPEEQARLVVEVALALMDAVDEALYDGPQKTKARDAKLLTGGKYLPPNVLVGDPDAPVREPKHWRAPVDPRCTWCGGCGFGEAAGVDCAACGGTGLRPSEVAPAEPDAGLGAD